MIALPSAPTYFRPAGFWIRTLAYLIDGLLLSLVGGAFPYLVISTNAASNHTAGAGSSASGGSVFVSLVYFVIFWSHYGGGRTLGMRLIGLRVVREDGIARRGPRDPAVDRAVDLVCGLLHRGSVGRR